MDDLSDVRKTLRENPDDPMALKTAAKYYLKEGYYRQAQAQYSQAVSFSPRLFSSVVLDYEEAIAREPGKDGTYLSLAGFFISQGELDAAILELEEVLEINPANVEAYNALGRIYIRSERTADAIALLEKSIAAGVKDVSLTETLAGAYLEKGRIAEAVKFYEEILLVKPNDKQMLRILGELYTRQENYLPAAQKYAAMFSDDPEVVREVIQRLEYLLKKIEGSIEIREILADIYMKTLNPEAAIEKLRQILGLESNKLGDIILKLKNILKNYPNLPSAVMALAEALRRQGNFSEAVESYHQLIKSNPELINDSISGYQEVLEYCPEQVLASSYLGEAFLSQSKVAEALLEFEKMLEADPSSADVAIGRCREVLRARPQLLQAHVVLGRAYLAKQDYQRAAAEAEGVIALDKKATAAYLLLGEAYEKLNLGRKAIETLHTALTLDPYNPQVMEAYHRAKKEELEREIISLNERLKEDQWKHSLRLDLAKGYIQKGEYYGAVRELQVLQKDPSRAPVAFNLLGNIYRGEGRYDLAAEHYSRALENLSPDLRDLSRMIRFNLGTVYEAQGDVRGAVKIYESIMQEEIDFGNLKSRVKQLKATNLANMRVKLLKMALFDHGKKEVIAHWGRDSQGESRQAKREEMSVSFGHEHNQEGFDYFIKGMYKAAEEAFNLAVQLDRRFPGALNNLGVAMLKSGKLEEARLKLIEAVNLNTGSAVFYNNLGVAYFLLGKMDPAKTAFEKSYSLDPESSTVCLNLGDLYFTQKESKKAVEFYRKVGGFDYLSDLADLRLLHRVP